MRRWSPVLGNRRLTRSKMIFRLTAHRVDDALRGLVVLVDDLTEHVEHLRALVDQALQLHRLDVDRLVAAAAAATALAAFAAAALFLLLLLELVDLLRLLLDVLVHLLHDQ